MSLQGGPLPCDTAYEMYTGMLSDSILQLASGNVYLLVSTYLQLTNNLIHQEVVFKLCICCDW